MALARRGYIAHGVWVPEFMLEQPEVLKSVHYEMAHAGSDVMEAFQVSRKYIPDVHVISVLLHSLLSDYYNEVSWLISALQ